MMRVSEYYNQLKTTLSNIGNYEPMTDAEIKAAAKRYIDDMYKAQRGSAQAAQAASDSALSEQLAGLLERYSRNEAMSREQHAEAVDRIGEQTRSRGSQRSNYSNDLDRYINEIGSQSYSRIASERDMNAGEINNARDLAKSQLAEQMAMYNANQQRDLRAYSADLKAREYDRSVSAAATESSVLRKLYEYEHQLELEEEAKKRRSASAAYSRGYGGVKKKEKDGTDPSDFSGFIDNMSRVGTLFVGSRATQSAMAKMAARKKDADIAALKKNVKKLPAKDKIALKKGPIK